MAAAINKEFNSTLKVLTVDDNQDLAFITGSILSLLGFRIQICHSGIDCIELAESTKPDVILLDIDMPDMDGFEVCKHIRKQTWGINLAIIAYTSRDLKSIKRRDIFTSFDKYLLKPAEIEPLSIAIVNTFRKKRINVS